MTALKLNIDLIAAPMPSVNERSAPPLTFDAKLPISRSDSLSDAARPVLSPLIDTLTSFLSGDASLYYSTGGGVLGGVGHAALQVAAKAFVRVASDFLDQTTQTSDHPLPATGQVYFYLVTPEGWRRAEATYAELMTGQGALAPLFAAGQEVITQFRQIEEAQAKLP